jgi:perosamine synthetase
MPELCCAVALAQVENINALVDRRKEVAKIFFEATNKFHNWFVPQKVGDGYVNSYWTWVCRNEHQHVTWHDIRDRFLANGGDGVYGAWKLSYLEPMFETASFLGREKFIDEKNRALYKRGLCPVAERLQTRLFHFKTKYWHLGYAFRQAEILRSTLAEFD